MKSNIEKIRAEINNKATARAENIKKSQEDLKAAGEKLTILNFKLAEAQELEEYEAIRAEIKEAEGVLDFCQRKSQQTKEKVLSDAEYREIIKAVNSEVENIQEKHAPKIKEALNNLLGLLDNYCKEVAEVESISKQAKALNIQPGGFNIACIPSNRDVLATFTPDTLEYQPHILGAYFQHRAFVEEIQANPEKIVKTEFNNPEARRIALALTNRR